MPSEPTIATRLPWRTRLVLALNALDALVLRLPCDICGDRRRCWRWHVEVFDCPICGTAIDEFHPRFNRVTPTLPTSTWTTTPTLTIGSTTYNIWMPGATNANT